MMFKYIKTEKGFSLVETLVSISILLLVIVGPMTVIARTSKSSTFATEQVQAFFLAQEGLELAQKGRDDLLLSHFVTAGSPWAAFINDTSGVYQNCYKTTGCGLEWSTVTNGALSPTVDCTTIANCLLNRRTTNRSKFTHTATTDPTVYTRVIRFTKSPSGGPTTAVLVTSTVTWRTGSLVASQRVVTETFLYNVYDTP